MTAVNLEMTAGDDGVSFFIVILCLHTGFDVSLSYATFSSQKESCSKVDWYATHPPFTFVHRVLWIFCVCVTVSY